MTASSNCWVVMPSNSVSSSSEAIWVTHVMFSSSPRLAASIARLILFASYDSRSPLRLTTVMPTENSLDYKNDWRP